MAEVAGIWRKKYGESSLKLYYSYSCTGETESTSRPFNINDAVNVRFKTRATLLGDKIMITLSFSVSKDDMKKNIIKINITCKDLVYSITGFNASENWSDWQDMGSKKTFNKEYPKLYYTSLFIFISVNEYENESIISKLYLDIDFTDFSLTVPEGSVAVHKPCLAAHSDVFKAMMKGEWGNKTEGQIKMNGVTLQTLQQLKDYIYLGIVPDDGLCPLLLVARYYLMEDLKKQCIRKLAETVSGKDLYSLIEFACDNNIPELSFAMLQLTQDNIVEEAVEIKKATDSEKENAN